jgi:hypothetical protein
MIQLKRRTTTLCAGKASPIGAPGGERRTAMAKEYTITLHEPPTTQIIREGMVQHLNQMAQDGWKMVNVVKESGYYYFFWERD